MPSSPISRRTMLGVVTVSGAAAAGLLRGGATEGPSSHTPTWASVDQHPPAPEWFQDAKFQGANPEPEPESGACRVATVVSSWSTGLTSEITITNTGAAAINGWSLAFTLPGGQTITSGWSASYSPAAGQVTARNVDYNAGIAAGASVSIGFQANHTGNTAEPSSYTLNGADCTIA